MDIVLKGIYDIHIYIIHIYIYMDRFTVCAKIRQPPWLRAPQPLRRAAEGLKRIFNESSGLQLHCKVQLLMDLVRKEGT